MSDNGFFNLNAKNVNAFLRAFDAKKLKPYVKTEELPDDRFEKNVLVLVGQNFIKEVKGKNVFVLF